METVLRADDRTNTLYQESEYTALCSQRRKRWLCLSIPCAALIALGVWAFIARNEVVINVATILAGIVLIAGYDLFIKPLDRYARHLHNALHGRVRQAELPFAAISEDVSMVDGVSCRAVTCVDYDAKSRPYDRLFYFDSLKPFPDLKEGDRVRVTHYDLTIADIELV